MIGAIIGDVIGSIYEANNHKSTDFPLYDDRSTFTDDTVLTVAIADAILYDIPYDIALKKWGLKYPDAGYGGNFRKWLSSSSNDPYNSWGNGSAMRVSPVGFAYDNLIKVLEEAKNTAEKTHNHPEGIKGAQATASAIFLARNGATKKDIKTYIVSNFGYNLSREIKDIRTDYQFDVSCQGSVPEAIIAFLESTDFENAIRLAISLGGDSDTIACIVGGISQAFYGNISSELKEFARLKLPSEMNSVIDAFEIRFMG